MTEREFYRRVQQEARIGDPALARHFALDTLAQLAYRVSPGQARHLAAQLPGKLKRVVLGRSGRTFRFDRREFLMRLSRDTGTDEDTCRRCVESVMRVLRGAVTCGELRHLESELPPGLRHLVEAGEPAHL